MRAQWLVCLLLMSACKEKPERGAPLPEPPIPVPSAPQGSATPSESWRVTAERIGPVEFGMTAEQFAALGGRAEIPADREYCVYGQLPSAPAPMLFMIENGRVARVDIDSATTATTEGARVGDTEARIQELYEGRVTVQPHKYTSGHYLFVPASNDSTRALVFETDGTRVVRYRAGLIPQVQYVEGCS